VPLADVAAWVWYGDTLLPRVSRVLLTPASAIYGAVQAQINMMAVMQRPEPGPIPALSVGNLSVGGTGKTPVSAWFATRCRALGASPAVVLRGYGDDEVHVHRLLNPDVPVVVGADRVAAVQHAADAGADVAILDDAFQHRRAHRVADVVLISADRWTGHELLLPAGPYREPLRALRRATLVLVTVKAARDDRVRAAEYAIKQQTGSTVVTVDLAPASFVAVGSQESAAVDSWRGRRVLAVSGIGDPVAFHQQLLQLGLAPVPLVFPDHHAFDGASVERITRAALGCDAVLCTLKDAVKLGPIWPEFGGTAVVSFAIGRSARRRRGPGRCRPVGASGATEQPTSL
jgi:tetraacyldisaccharide 4'-kinase